MFLVKDIPNCYLLSSSDLVMPCKQAGKVIARIQIDKYKGAEGKIAESFSKLLLGSKPIVLDVINTPNKTPLDLFYQIYKKFKVFYDLCH